MLNDLNFENYFRLTNANRHSALRTSQRRTQRRVLHHRLEVRAVHEFTNDL